MLEVTSLKDAKEVLFQKKVVIFDLDDTLFSEKDYVKSGYKKIAESFPQIKDMQQKLWLAFESGHKAINYVLENEGLFSEENLNKALTVYRSHVPEIELYEDAKTLISILKESGVRLGIITDGRPEGQKAKIKALGIESLFEKIIITDELGGLSFRKPSPEAFKIMQDFFNVPFEDMVYVGDNPEKDFIAPSELKMDSVYFVNPEGLYSKRI